MGTKMPKLRSQTSEDIYEEALKLTETYCPELKKLSIDPSIISDDPAQIILKVFSKMTELLLTQVNKMPDKYRLAFFDFIGLDLLPSSPAKVPLTFYLSEGSPNAYVPARTAIASSNDSSVVFETLRDLNAIDTGLTSVFSVDPSQDRYTEHKDAISGKEDGFYIFGGDETSGKKLDHVLYLGDETLFAIKSEAKVKISFEGENLSKEYFSHWADGDNNSLAVNEIQTTSPTKITVTLSVPELDRTLVNKYDNFWLSVRPDETVQIANESELPDIKAITACVSADGIIPDIVFFNNILMDPKKGFYPFGEGPNKIGDSFYVGSEEAFSKKGAKISLNITAVKKDKIDINLVWEYWNGSKWEKLEVEVEPDNDYVKRFQESGSIAFTCPTIPITDINGQLNRWIRVRIESGNYGTTANIEQQDTAAIVEKLASTVEEDKEKFKDQLIAAFKATEIAFGFEYTKEDLDPPLIQSIYISYDYKKEPLICENKPSTKKVFNNFKFEDFESGKPYSPYKLVPNEGAHALTSALYLGFEKDIAGVSLNLFFAVKERLSNEEQNDTPLEDQNFSSTNVINLVWEYPVIGGEWREFRVEDETESFRTGGIVSFFVPSDIERSFEFGKEMYWLRARIKDSNKVPFPKLKGIFPNTVWALNSITVENEILGSGNGEPNLSLYFAKKSILDGEIIEIQEPTVPSRDELRALEAGNKDALRIKEEAGEIKEVWARWTRTADFALSNALSRDYVLDRKNGKIIFGDGTHGMIPPRGKNNIVAKQYQSGGGKKGDVAAGTLTSLKRTIPHIESVTNKVAASGGMDQEDLESAVSRGPYALKSGGRAVTREDFEWLSYEASQYVARARCIIKGGNVKVIIVPISEEDIPLPDAALLDLIQEYLKTRALITISERISVVGPKYEKISVKIKFKPVSLAQSGVVADKIKERVEQFLHPLKGGPNGEGWDFGQSIFISEMAAVVENIDGVDYVTLICLKKEGKKSVSGVKSMEIESDSLPHADIKNIDVEPDLKHGV